MNIEKQKSSKYLKKYKIYESNNKLIKYQLKKKKNI